MTTKTTSDPAVTRGDFDVLCWRFDELVRAGYGANDAMLMAETQGVDLHQACALLEQGASPTEALRILL